MDAFRDARAYMKAKKAERRRESPTMTPTSAGNP